MFLKRLTQQAVSTIRVLKDLLHIRIISLAWLTVTALVITEHLILLNPGLGPIEEMIGLLLVVAFVYLWSLLITTLTLPHSAMVDGSDMLLMAVKRLGKNWWQVIVATMLTVIMLLPFGSLGFSGSLLARLPLPASWINNVGLHRLFFLPIAAVIYLGLAIVCVTWLHWPIAQLLGQSAPHQFKRNMGALIRSVLIFAVPVIVLVEALIALEWWLMQIVNEGWGIAITAIIGLLTLIVLWLAITLMIFSLLMALVGYTTGPLNVHQSEDYKSISWFPLSVVILLMGLFTWQLFDTAHHYGPAMTISHRGETDNVGVQNTIPALKHTIQLRPDFVEMDIQWTKDHQFVVMHDANLKHLTGLNKTPQDLTLAQLTKLTAKEHGQASKVASFDEYLRTANAAHQRLIVEIKSTGAHPQAMVSQFAKQYTDVLLRNGDLVHSLDYRVVSQLMAQSPTLSVGYITPFNFASLKNVPADFYSLQEISLNRQIILQAEQLHRPTLVWTTGNRRQIGQMAALGVNGQITNQLGELKAFNQQPAYKNNWAVLQNLLEGFI